MVSKISSDTEVFIDKISDSCGETEYSPRVPTGERCLFIYDVLYSFICETVL